MDLPFLPRDMAPVADAHVHFYGEAEAENLLEAEARFGVRRVFASCLGPPPLNYNPTMEDCRRFNRITARVRARHAESVVGCAYVNPCHEGEALAELRTCVEELGLRGLKLWMACYCDDPRVYPVVEQAATYGVPILIHTATLVGGSKPNESEAHHVARLAGRFPEAKILMAHMSFDWSFTLKAIRACPNVHVDPSGTDPEDGQIETALAELGAQRVLFGSDAPIRDLGSQLAKVYGAEVDEATRRLLFWDNFQRLMGQGGQVR